VASAVVADLELDAMSTSDTPLVPTWNVTAAAGDPASAVGLNPDVAVCVQVLGVTWTVFAVCLPLLADGSDDEYLPVAAGAAAATPLTCVSRALRSVFDDSPPSDAVLAEAVPDAAAELDPPPQAANPATATGTSSSPDAIRQRLPAILHPLTLWIPHMTMREDSAPGVATTLIN
jgi:hypothetical protein